MSEQLNGHRDGERPLEWEALPPQLDDLQRRLETDADRWGQAVPDATRFNQRMRILLLHEASATSETATEAPAIAAATDHTGETPPARRAPVAAGARARRLRSGRGAGASSAGARVAGPASAAGRRIMPLVAALLLVAMAAALFAALGITRHTPGTSNGVPPTAIPTPAGTPTSCAPNPNRTGLPPGAAISDLVLVSPSEGWAVGDISTQIPACGTTLIMHLSGGAWRPVTETVPGYTLTSIAMASPAQGWASGRSYDGTRQLLLQYANGRWQPMPLSVDPAANTANGRLAMARGEGCATALATQASTGGVFAFGLYCYAQGQWTTLLAPRTCTADTCIAPVSDAPVFSFGPGDAWLIAGCNVPGCGGNYPEHFPINYSDQWTPSTDPYQFTQLEMDSPTSGWAAGYENIVASDQQPPYQLAVLFRFQYGSPFSDWTQESLPGWVGNSQTGGYELSILLLGTSDDGWGFGESLAPGESGPTARFVISAAYHYHGGQLQKVAWPIKSLATVTMLVRVSDSEYWAIGQLLNDSTVLLHEVNGAWSEYP